MHGQDQLSTSTFSNASSTDYFDLSQKQLISPFEIFQDVIKNSKNNHHKSTNSTKDKNESHIEHDIFITTSKYDDQIESKIPLTNSALCVLRILGAYLSVAYSMPIISHDVLIRLSQFLEFYITGMRLTILAHLPDKSLPNKLLNLINRVDQEPLLELTQLSFTASSFQNNQDGSKKLCLEPDCLLIAAESCIFIEKQFKNLRPTLKELFRQVESGETQPLDQNQDSENQKIQENLLKLSQKDQTLSDAIDYLYSESVLILSLFVVPIYTILSSQVFRKEVLPLISGIYEGINWKEINEIQIVHSQYWILGFLEV